MIFIFVGACQQNNKRNLSEAASQENSIKKNYDSIEPIIIVSSTDDPKALQYMTFWEFSKFPGLEQNKPYRDTIDGSLKLNFDYIEQPQIIQFFSFGDSLFRSTRMFVTPGDTISMNLKNKEIVFSGKNAAHYNFYFQLDPTSREWGLNEYKGDLMAYKKGAEAIYERHKKFFKHYVAKNDVSNEFKTIVSAELWFEYLYNLIAPRAVDTPLEGSVNDPEFLKTISQNYDVEKYGFIDTQSYLGQVTIADFQRPELLDNYFFQSSLVSFIRYYFVNTDYMSYTLKNFQAEEVYIQKNLDGELEDYLLARLLHDYYNKGLGQGKKDNEYLKKYIKKHKANMTDPSHKESFSIIEQELDLKGFGFGEGAMDEKWLTLTGDTLTLGEVLKSTKNKIKVFDFWATWCPPCITEIRETPEFRRKLELKYNLEWILVSIDTDQKKWKETSKELQADMNSEHQYIISNLKKSEIVRSLSGGTKKMFPIPRYVIVGPEGEIEVYAAPKPTDTLQFKKIIENIY